MSSVPVEPKTAPIADDTVREQAADASLSPPAACEDGQAAKEVGGPRGPEPTRFGDWERKGRCIDF